MNEEKKIEFMTLEWRDTIMAEYHARLLALERFMPRTFHTERQRTTKFMSGLRLSLLLAMSMFHYATFEDALARAMEGEATHHIYHMGRS